MNNLPHDHVHTGKYTQIGATLQYYNIQIMSLQQPHSQSSKSLVSKKEGRTKVNLESLSFICPTKTWCLKKSRTARILHSQCTAVGACLRENRVQRQVHRVQGYRVL